jgi:hypothetical protein
MDDLIQSFEMPIRLYAEDTTLYIAYSDPARVVTTMEENLNSVLGWATAWHILFNPDKTISLTFTCKRAPNDPDVLMGNTFIWKVNSHNHLRVTLHSSEK